MLWWCKYNEGCEEWRCKAINWWRATGHLLALLWACIKPSSWRCCQAIEINDALDVTYEVTKLVKYSPKHDTLLEKLKETLTPGTPGFRVLCPTRWSVWADLLKSIVDNYDTLQELWEVSKDQVSDPSIKARIIGVEAQFRTFRYLFGVLVDDLILRANLYSLQNCLHLKVNKLLLWLWQLSSP